MKKSIFMISLVSVMLMSSCASKKPLLECQEENKALQANYQNTKEQLAASTTRVAALEEQIAELRKTNATLQASLDKRLTNTSQNNVSIENLTRSLSKEELKEVDVQVLKGVVYISLADNMLYESGTYTINKRASETLSKIAKIIKDYKDYDVLIEGNTDDVPIKRENIRNNWDLSCLRASSVVQALQNDYGVDPKRLTAGGRGEYNPLQPNTTEVGKQRNRRTQIIITPKLDEFMDLIGQAPESK